MIRRAGGSAKLQCTGHCKAEAMMSFEPILQAALERRGGEAALAARLPHPKSPDELAAVDDARYLSLMSQRIFRAGLKHSLVDAKWPAFEEAFHGFDPRRVRAMSDEALEALMSDRRLIRHWGKIKSVRENAAALMAVSAEHGGFGRYLADWPVGNIVGLWEALGKRFAQMGGSSGPAFLRMAGKDTFMLTDAVVGALNHWGGFDGMPKTKRDRALVQERFNVWATETGRPLCELSMILALSVD
jgi:3-methyladenine DNA glycosylase Tag